MRIPTSVAAAIVAFTFAPAEAQEPPAAPTRLFVAPIAKPELNEGPTRYEYLEHLMDAPECAGIVPTSREDTADFVVWFEFEAKFRTRHYMTLWDASGNRVAGGLAGGSDEIVAAVCGEIAAAPAE